MNVCFEKKSWTYIGLGSELGKVVGPVHGLPDTRGAVRHQPRNTGLRHQDQVLQAHEHQHPTRPTYGQENQENYGRRSDRMRKVSQKDEKMVLQINLNNGHKTV